METFLQLETFWMVFMAACGAVIAIGGAAAVIAKLIQLLRKPSVDNAHTLEEFETYLASDKRRIENLERNQATADEQNKLILKALNKLLRHEIDGNHTDQLIAVSDEIQDYLIEK